MYSKLSDEVNLEGKVCLVTGASKGIGKGIAVQLALHGAKCYITGRKIESLKEIAQEVKRLGGSGMCIPIQCDHSQDDQVSNVFGKIAEDNDGRLDLLVNNAFSAVAFIAKNLKCKFWDQPPEAWDEINNVGLRNNYRCSVHAAKLMVERRNGLIINVSSVGGLRYLFSVPYGIGKAAKDRMAQDCAHELHRYGVAYISLWPGLVKTEFMEKSVDGNQVFGGKFNNDVLKRAETPAFVGKTVAALLSGSDSERRQYPLGSSLGYCQTLVGTNTLGFMTVNQVSHAACSAFLQPVIRSEDRLIRSICPENIEPHPLIMERSGRIILTGQIARAHNITDEEGRVPDSLQQVNLFLRTAGYPTLASYVPDCVRIPFWLMTAVAAIQKTW